jgi:hypothetical protein
MWLVLCDAEDRSALWAYRRLQARGLAPLELVTGEMLAFSQTWEHRLGKAGATFDIALADGRHLRRDEVRGVLNRLRGLPTAHLVRASSVDRDYATQELFALVLSCLQALPNVVNRASPQAFSGQWLPRAQWLLLAAQAGMLTVPFSQTDAEPADASRIGHHRWSLHRPTAAVLVLGGRVLGRTVPPEVVGGCRRLAALAGATLLGVDLLADGAGGWAVTGVNSFPDLLFGGEDFIDELELELRGGRSA